MNIYTRMHLKIIKITTMTNFTEILVVAHTINILNKLFTSTMFIWHLCAFDNSLWWNQIANCFTVFWFSQGRVYWVCRPFSTPVAVLWPCREEMRNETCSQIFVYNGSFISHNTDMVWDGQDFAFQVCSPLGEAEVFC